MKDQVHLPIDLTKRQWFCVVCSLIDKDIFQHSGQILLWSHSALPRFYHNINLEISESSMFEEKGSPAVYFALLHVMDAPNTYKSKLGEEIIWNLKSYQGWKIQLCFRVTLVIKSAQHSLFVCSLLKDNSVILLLKDNSACFYPSQVNPIKRVWF